MRRVTMVPAMVMAMAATTAAVGVGAAGAQSDPVTCDGLEATILGTDGDDEIEGTDGDDVIVTFGGDDAVVAGRGDDVVCSGSGNDVVFAGVGDDIVLAGSGSDFVNSGPGHDTVLGGIGADTLRGRNGVDTLVGGRGVDDLSGGPGWDDCPVGPGADTRARCEVHIVAESPDLAGVAFESPAARAIARLSFILGPPTADSGWTIGCPLDGDEVTLDSRTVSWGSLRAAFVGGPGERMFQGWSYPTFGSPEPGGPGLGQLALPGGFAVGDPIGEVAEALEATLEPGDPFFGLMFTVDDLVLIATAGPLETDPIDTVFVGPFEACE